MGIQRSSQQLSAAVLLLAELEIDLCNLVFAQPSCVSSEGKFPAQCPDGTENPNPVTEECLHLSQSLAQAF